MPSDRITLSERMQIKEIKFKRRYKKETIWRHYLQDVAVENKRRGNVTNMELCKGVCCCLVIYSISEDKHTEVTLGVSYHIFLCQRRHRNRNDIK